MKYMVRNLEVHANHTCNLFCESCSHYSSLGADKGPSAEECIKWMVLWKDRLAPRQFSILGGEPTINPNLSAIVRAAGYLWPESEIRVVSNGMLLHLHPALRLVMNDIGQRARLDVSKHHNSPEYTTKFASVLQLLEDWKEQGASFRIKIMPSDEKWARHYFVENGKFTPASGDPRKAWECCIGKSCNQLYEGYIWKCPEIAYASMLMKKVEVDEYWKDLFNSYVPLSYNCSDEELEAFLLQEEESICEMCPNSLEHFKLPNPLVRIHY